MNPVRNLSLSEVIKKSVNTMLQKQRISNGVRKFITSESVTEGHPDKVADQISDGILDAILEKDPLARVACETFLPNGMIIVGGEITTDCYVDIKQVIRNVIKEIGYDKPGLWSGLADLRYFNEY
jgi:S-adenosylmethionine synthetase